MSSGEYLYVKIYRQLLEEIQNNTYKKGERLPTEKELSDLYQVSRITSQKAMNRLVEEGIVIRHPGIGSFVSEDYIKEETEQVLMANGTREEDLVIVQRKSSRKIIGLVLEAIWDCFGIGVFDGAYAKARSLGYDLVIKKSFGDQKQEMEVIDELIDMGAEGIIIMPVHGDYYNEEILKLVVEKFPIVFVDRFLNGIHVPFVGSDNVRASEECVEYFVNKGRREIALITAKEHEATTIAERKEGYLQGHINCGLRINKEYIYDDVKCIVPNKWCPKEAEETLESIQSFLVKHPKVTAVVAAEYFIGNFVKLAVKKMGKRVPEDLSIICFDAPRKYLQDYEFTHIRQNEEKMGEEAVRMIHQCIESGQWEEKMLIATSLVEGRSTNKEDGAK